MVLRSVVACIRFRGRRHVSRWTCVLCMILLYHLTSSYFRLPSDIIRYYQLLQRKMAVSEKKMGDGPTCRVPRLDPYDQSIQKYISKPNPLVCKKVQWDLTYLDEKGVLRINETEMKLSGYSDLECSARCYDHNSGVDDDTVKYGEWTIFEQELSLGCQFVEVSCIRQLLRLSIYSYHFVNISRPSKPLYSTNTESSAYSNSASSISIENMSVVVFAIDSMSGSNMIRQLPSAYSYIMKEMNGISFDGHTKIGDNTWVNLLAMVSGLRSVPTQQFPADLSQIEDQFFDDYAPYIWRNFSRSGYFTLFSEDRPDIHTFNYGVRKGFRNRPFDYYDRPFWTSTWASFVRKRSSGFCYNTMPEHRIQFDYLLRFVREHRADKHFGIVWWQGLTHDFLNTIGFADQDTTNFLKSLRPYLNRTILFVISDHGHRYHAIRESVIGRLEARLPFMAMVVPDWFRQRYPNVMKNMKLNAESRLTTQFDIYATLVDILENRITNQERSPSSPSYAISLFRPIPMNRTCFDARIPEEYCPCYTELELPLTEPMVQRAASVLVAGVNKLLSRNQPPCAKLSIIRIVQSFASVPPQKATMHDPQVANRVASGGFYVMYRVVVRTRPGDALLEGIVKHFVDRDAMTIESDVERNNAYGNTSYCVQSSLLKKYCYCLKQGL